GPPGEPEPSERVPRAVGRVDGGVADAQRRDRGGARQTAAAAVWTVRARRQARAATARRGVGGVREDGDAGAAGGKAGALTVPRGVRGPRCGPKRHRSTVRTDDSVTK